MGEKENEEAIGKCIRKYVQKYSLLWEKKSSSIGNDSQKMILAKDTKIQLCKNSIQES